MRTRARQLMTVGMSALMLASGRQVAAAAQDQRTALLNAERATAEQSRDSGLAAALLGNIYREGILLWPGAPVVSGTVNLKQLLAATALDSLQLTWRPLGIELARDSTLGVTWGVAAANASRNLPSPEIGSYIATWRRDGGAWTIAALVFAGLPRLPKPVLGKAIPVSHEAIEARGSAGPFVAADLAFARLAGDSGAPVAFERWAAPEAVTFGDGGLLARGPKAIGRAVDFPAVWRWHPVAAGAAGTGDLGWTVGEATIATKGAEPSYSKYLTVWIRRADGTVRFLTDSGNGRPPSP